MLAIKDNKQYFILENEKEKYLLDGYDIADDKGKIVEFNRGRTVSYTEYMELKKQKTADKDLKDKIKALEKENRNLKKGLKA